MGPRVTAVIGPVMPGPKIKPMAGVPSWASPLGVKVKVQVQVQNYFSQYMRGLDQVFPHLISKF